jgi:signal transduction histidine kinase
MKTPETTVSELVFMFKLIPLLQEVDNVDRLYRLLLAIVTSGETVGYPRAMLFVPDEQDGVVRGRYGIEHAEETHARGGGHAAKRTEGERFDEMARAVFQNFEHVDASDLTVQVRSYSVPMSWYRSALVKAARATYPVLAERGASEFATDTFFDYFGVTSYIALPIEIDRRVVAVLAVDRSAREDRSSTDEISVLYSLVQQTAAAAGRLLENSSHRRRARILSKLHSSLAAAATASELEESIRAGLAMVTRAVDASLCVVRDGHSQKTIRVDSTSRADGAAEDETLITAMGEVLELSAGTLEPVEGDSAHPRLEGGADKRISFFFACPLLVGRNCFGALAVCTENGDRQARLIDFRPADKTFLELCASAVASAMEARRSGDRIGRLEDLIQELGANLVRERKRSRLGDRSVEYHMRFGEDIRHLRRLLAGKETPGRLSEIAGVVDSMQHDSALYWDDVVEDKGDFAMTDLFELVRRAAEKWRSRAEGKGIQVTVRVPDRGPSLLLDRSRIGRALENILTATLSCLEKEDKVLVECSLADGRALICVADTGRGLPGDAVSRLFMPFVDVADRDEGTRALSLAGDILQQHCAEVMIKSTSSWRTILVLSFPMSAGRDRRKRPSDRRGRGDRRVISGAEKS